MAQLHIALQEGFDGDEVRVHVGGRLVYQKKGVTTRMQIGLADSFDVTPSDSDVEVRLEVPSRTASSVLSLKLDRPLYLAVSLTRRGDIHHQVSHEPFKYA
jgi:hypothetical protein